MGKRKLRPTKGYFLGINFYVEKLYILYSRYHYIHHWNLLSPSQDRKKKVKRGVLIKYCSFLTAFNHSGASYR